MREESQYTVSKRVLTLRTFLAFWVLNYISGSLFSLFWFHSRILSHICSHWFRFTLLANFDFYLCLRINFHTSSFWVLILAAGGPYWVLISQKNGSLLGPYLKAWGSLLVLETVKLELVISYLAKFQVHSGFTNLLLLLALLLAVFFSLDYNRPIVQRREEVII